MSVTRSRTPSLSGVAGGYAPLDSGLLIPEAYIPKTGAGAPGMILLESHTAATSSQLDFTTFISSTYDTYRFELLDLIPTTDNVNLLFRAGTGGGPSYDSSGVYAGSGFRWSNSGTAVTGSTTGTAFGMDVSGGIDNGSGRGIAGHVMLYLPQSTTPAPRITSQMSYTDNANVPLGAMGNGQYNGGAAMTAVRFLMSSGTIASGTVRVYGIPK